MHNVRFFCNPMLLALVISLLLPAIAAAQTEAPAIERLDSWMRQMEEQMRRTMPMDSFFQDGFGQMRISPDSNSFFYFRVDTSFNGSGSHFFDFHSFGNPEGADFFGQDFQRLFDQFFDGAAPFSRPPDRNMPPADDGNNTPADDNLLPEERLRKQDSRTLPQKENKVKTIRI